MANALQLGIAVRQCIGMAFELERLANERSGRDGIKRPTRIVLADTRFVLVQTRFVLFFTSINIHKLLFARLFH